MEDESLLWCTKQCQAVSTSPWSRAVHLLPPNAQQPCMATGFAPCPPPPNTISRATRMGGTQLGLSPAPWCWGTEGLGERAARQSLMGRKQSSPRLRAHLLCLLGSGGGCWLCQVLEVGLLLVVPVTQAPVKRIIKHFFLLPIIHPVLFCVASFPP